MVWNMDEIFLSKALKEKKVKLSELPDGFDIESLPSDTIFIFDDDDPSATDEYWENEEWEKGYVEMQTGRTKNAKKAFADIRKDYGL